MVIKLKQLRRMSAKLREKAQLPFRVWFHNPMMSGKMKSHNTWLYNFNQLLQSSWLSPLTQFPPHCSAPTVVIQTAETQRHHWGTPPASMRTRYNLSSPFWIDLNILTPISNILHVNTSALTITCWIDIERTTNQSTNLYCSLLQSTQTHGQFIVKKSFRRLFQYL